MKAFHVFFVILTTLFATGCTYVTGVVPVFYAPYESDSERVIREAEEARQRYRDAGRAESWWTMVGATAYQRELSDTLWKAEHDGERDRQHNEVLSAIGGLREEIRRAESRLAAAIRAGDAESTRRNAESVVALENKLVEALRKQTQAQTGTATAMTTTTAKPEDGIPDSYDETWDRVEEKIRLWEKTPTPSSSTIKQRK